MRIISKKIHYLILMAVIFFAVTMILSFGFMDYSMAMNSDGSMSSCPFNMSGSFCSMSFQEHLSEAKLAFSAIPQKLYFANILFIIVLVIALKISKDILSAYDRFLYSRQLIYFKNINASIFNPIKEAFSQGIINPKVF